MSDIQTPMLTGDDRLEVLPAAGRPFRMGSVEALSRSDRQWLADVAGDPSEFARRAEYLCGATCQMFGGYTEMALSWMAMVGTLRGADEGHAFIEAVLARWNDTREKLPPPLEAALARAFHPLTCRLDAADEFRARSAAREATIVQPLIEALSAALVTLKERKDVEAYWRIARSLHDATARLIWTCASVSLIRYGQATAERLQEDALHTCSFLEPMWQPVAHLPADALAAILAEHLRAHFCGPDGEGKVEIIEERDRYRLSMDPCGSGGAIRRASPRTRLDEETFAHASAMSWQQKGVPSFCSHCALNEQISMRRFGYPAWVTEFDPAADRPCAWTVFKRREDIPREYFERLDGAAQP